MISYKECIKEKNCKQALVKRDATELHLKTVTDEFIAKLQHSPNILCFTHLSKELKNSQNI